MDERGTQAGSSGLAVRSGVPPREAADRWQTAATSLVFALALAVLVLEIVVALDPRWGYDEAWHLYISTVSPWSKALEEALADGHPPLYYLLLVPFAALGPDPLWFRLPATIATAVAVPIWYFLLRRLRVETLPAILGTYLFATGFALLELGPTVRAYSLGMLCLVAGLYAMAPRLPGAVSRPPARGTVAIAAAFTAGFWFMYSAVFVTVALVVALALVSFWRGAVSVPRLGRSTPLLTRRDRLAVALLVVGHAAMVLWFVAAYGRRGAAAPDHVSQFVLAEGGSALEFVLSGLAANAGWLYPQFGGAAAGRAAAAAFVLLTAASALFLAIRRAQPQWVVLSLAALLLTAILIVAGLAGFYPFGGYLRHQFVLMPLYLLVVCFLLDAGWGQARRRAAKVLLAAGVIVFGAAGLQRATGADPLGEAHGEVPWAGIVGKLPEARDRPPVYLDASSFFPIYGAQHRSGVSFRRSLAFAEGRPVAISYGGGWLASLRLGRDWDVYDAYQEGRPVVSLIRDRKTWVLPALPDDRFTGRLASLMRHEGIESIRMLRMPSAATGAGDPDAMRARYATGGLELTGFVRLPGVETWLLRLPAPSSTGPGS